MSTNEKIAARLKEAREKKGISQKTLADWCGWAQSRVGNYESGARGVGADDAITLANALGVTASELMFGDNGDPSQWLTDKQQRMLELYNQLPEAEQDRMIDLFQIRLKEIDDYVEKYLRGRYKKDD